MNLNIPAPFDVVEDWGSLNRRKQRAEREQRAYQRRLLRLRSRDRKWGGPLDRPLGQLGEKRSRACLDAEIRAAQAITVPVLSQEVAR